MLLYFLVIFLWLFGWYCFAGFYFKVNKDTYVEGFTNYVLCNAAMEEDCVNEHPIPVWIAYVGVINIANAGTYVLMLFGFQPKVLRHWKNLLTHLFRGDLRALAHLSIEANSSKSSIRVGGVGKVSSVTPSDKSNSLSASASGFSSKD